MSTFFWVSIVTLSNLFSSFCCLIRMAELSPCAVFGVDPPVLSPEGGNEPKLSYLPSPFVVAPSFTVFEDCRLFRDAETIGYRPIRLTWL